MKRVTIVEPAYSHEEVIYPQIELLRDAFEVHVVAPEALLNVDLLKETEHLYHAHPFTSVPLRRRWRRALNVPQHYLALQRAVDATAPDLIVFNTIRTLPEALLLMNLLRRYRKVQIIHEFQKHLAMFGRRLYGAFDGNLVLSEQVHQHVRSTHPAFSDLGYFLPIFFDSFIAARAPEKAAIIGSPSVLTLGVFGTIEGCRRNYWGLLNALRDLNLCGRARNFRVHLVGKAPHAVHQFVIANGLGHVVELSREFVPFRRMFAALSNIDIVLFLIDRGVAGMRLYNRYKITGTSTLVKGFRKAAAVSQDFAVDESLADMCFSYPGTDIGSFLRRIAEGEITADDVRAKTRQYERRSLFAFGEQQRRLVAFLTKAMGA